MVKRESRFQFRICTKFLFCLVVVFVHDVCALRALRIQWEKQKLSKHCRFPRAKKEDDEQEDDRFIYSIS